MNTALVVHEQEKNALTDILSGLKDNGGRVVLISGEAGAGVTTCIEDCLAQTAFHILRGHSRESNVQPFSPLIQILRNYIRGNSAILEQCGSFRDYLSIVLPELGNAPENSDRATLFEAIQCVLLSAVEHEEGIVIFLDDLQWSDSSSLEWLSFFAHNIQTVPLLIIGAYRSDEITRNHPIRRFRNELRRTNRLSEIEIAPLSEHETGQLLESLLENEADTSLVKRLFELSQGIPLFIIELCQALQEDNQLLEQNGKIALLDESKLSLPENVKDIILLRLARLSEDAMNLLEVMAVAGVEFELKHILAVSENDSGLADLIEGQVILETSPGYVRFRHALTREVVYRNIIWTRRQSLHLKMAEILQDAGVFPRQIAEHWLAGHDTGHAREALIESADEFCRIHAYRDAVDTAQEALNLGEKWDSDEQRIRLLHRLAHCARISGMFTEATQALREILALHETSGAELELAEIQNQLATVYSMQQMWDQMLDARKRASEIYVAHRVFSEAAEQQLAISNYMHGAGIYTPTLEIVANAIDYARKSNQIRIEAQAMGLEGQIRAKLGQFEEALELAQSALSLALDNQLNDVAAIAYIKLATVYECHSKRDEAKNIYNDAINYCATHGDTAREKLCFFCVAAVYSETGEWDEFERIARYLIENDIDPASHAGVLSFLIQIDIQRGNFRQARKNLKEARTIIHWISYVHSHIRLEWGAAHLDLIDQNIDSALRRCRHILSEWQKNEEWLFSIAVIRFIATTFAQHNQVDDLQQCASGLVGLSNTNHNPEVMSSLAYVLGEIALLEKSASLALEHFRGALTLFEPLKLPLYEAEMRFRLAHALVANQQIEEAIEELVIAHRLTQSIGAVTTGKQILAMLDELNASIEERLGQRVADRHQRAGLTKRQLEVLALMADGLTNVEIAEQLVLSPRTAEMHVGNILNKLNCSTRTEAVRIAVEQGLLS